MPARGIARIGVSGFRYPHWRGVFYPEGLRQRDELAYASRAVDSIEVNGSFYGLLHASAVERWRNEAPEGFVFAVKGSRFITHMKRLRDARLPLANFFASGVLAFEEKLGPILWQLPPSFSFDAARLEKFFVALPRTTRQAAKLARAHDARVKDPRVATAADRPLRYALEVRHTSFLDRAFYALLRAHDVALCVADPPLAVGARSDADTARVHPDFDEVTADFVYVRLHGGQELYVSGYSRKALASWARRVERWQGAGRDVYVYFDNDARARAPFDARTLRSMINSPLPARLAPFMRMT